MSTPVVLHLDWIGARETLLRTWGVTLAVGVIWQVTGWDAGAFMMLGTAIVTTVFSTADNPVHTMRLVIIGQVLGVAGALACRWLAWPLATGELGLILWMMPFVLLGAVITAHQRTTSVSFDYNMVLLLLLQPAWPLAGSAATSFSSAAAVLLCPVIALLSFRMFFPANGSRRLKALIRMMVLELEAMSIQSGAARRRTVWRIRLYHRLLKLVHQAGKIRYSTKAVVDGSFAVLIVGSAVLHLDELSRSPDLSARVHRWLKATRARLGRVGTDPVRAARALKRFELSYAKEVGADSMLLRDAAAALVSHSAFFEQSASGQKLPAS